MKTKAKHAMTPEKAASVKKSGHEREEIFNSYFGFERENFKVNYTKNGADNVFAPNNEDYLPLCEKLKIENLPTESKEIPVSLKSSNTIQIHLGKFPELTNKETFQVTKEPGKPTKVSHGISFSEQLKALKDIEFWNKYLKKGEVLCYTYSKGEYIFFKMDDVIDFIVSKGTWRNLDTGRLKCDFDSKDKNGNQKRKQFLTYEYRAEHKSFVLGAHGGKKGREFIDLLTENINFYKISKKVEK